MTVIQPPINVYGSLEQATKEAAGKIIPLQIAIQGIPVRHQRQITRAENQVYGTDGGTPKNANLRFLGNEKILMNGSHWRYIDGTEAGYLEQPGWVYCIFDLKNGDILTIQRLSDSRQIDFVASQVQEIGNTVTILKRFMISNINGS